MQPPDHGTHPHLYFLLFCTAIFFFCMATKTPYSGMQKSERPKSKQCGNPNNRLFEQTCSDFRSFGSFDCSDLGIHSIRMPIMPKSERSNRIVRISDDIFCPKSEQIVRISALFSVRTKSSTKQRGSVRNPNTFGFQHSTVFLNVRK